MDLAAAYLLLRQLHLPMVGISVALFAARGLGVLAGGRWPMAALPRWGSVGVDTALLATGVGLWALLGLHPVRQPWLGTKLLLLLVYIVLGSIALRRGRTPARRALAFAAALLTVAAMAGIALARHPAGWWMLAGLR